jgi:magnesium-transporting ATPase (P-type)
MMNRKQRRAARSNENITPQGPLPEKKKGKFWILLLGLFISLVVFVASLFNGRGLDTFIMAAISLMFAVALIIQVAKD